MEQLKKAIKGNQTDNQTSKGTQKEINQECQDLEQEIKKLCESQGKTLEDKVPLQLIF